MMPDEYEKERNYFNDHWDDYVHGLYVPLWKQKEQK